MYIIGHQHVVETVKQKLVYNLFSSIVHSVEIRLMQRTIFAHDVVEGQVLVWREVLVSREVLAAREVLV